MSAFTERQRTLDTYWRSIILFGQNVTSYKFALAQSLIDLSETRSSAVSLEQLAVPFSRHLSDHSKAAPKQTTSRSVDIWTPASATTKDSLRTPISSLRP